jgi:hypothetical protein
MQLSDRRTFLRNAATLAGAFPVANAFSATSHFQQVAQNDSGRDFWSVIQRSYSVNPGYHQPEQRRRVAFAYRCAAGCGAV